MSTERELIDRLRGAINDALRSLAPIVLGDKIDPRIPAIEARGALNVAFDEADAYLTGTAASAEGFKVPVAPHGRHSCPEHGWQTEVTACVKCIAYVEAERDRLADQLREAQAVTRRECAEELRAMMPTPVRSPNMTNFGATPHGADLHALADRWSAPAAPAPDPAVQGSIIEKRSKAWPWNCAWCAKKATRHVDVPAGRTLTGQALNGVPACDEHLVEPAQGGEEGERG